MVNLHRMRREREREKKKNPKKERERQRERERDRRHAVSDLGSRGPQADVDFVVLHQSAASVSDFFFAGPCGALGVWAGT